ncbi:MAG: terminase [Bacteroidales bacterium]|nr:terminase [Bacteroidales bacterium]
MVRKKSSSFLDSVSVESVLKENQRRLSIIDAPFDPISGKGSIGERCLLHLNDFAIPDQWIPFPMIRVPLVNKLRRAGSIESFLRDELHVLPDESERAKVADTLIRIRLRYDFPFWAACFCRIHNKDAGRDVLFRLRRPQRILVSAFEEDRLAGKPIRLILLKARQWGGSTTTQLYMAWLQFLHKKGLNSLIIAHQGTASDEIKDMFDTMIKSYPVSLLYEPGQSFNADEPKLVGVGKSGSTSRVPQRGCKIKIGTAERPDGCRGGAYSLVHLSEVGLWKKTEGKTPEDIVRSACSGVLLKPLTMIVLESTANGTGNFFHSEYLAAEDPDCPSQFKALFIPWFAIEQYSIPFQTPEHRAQFAAELIKGRKSSDAASSRQESGAYLWSLFEKGATLEAINWYILERAGRNSHAVMASEYPSDPLEAFVHSGSMVFDEFLVQAMRSTCRPPRFTGEVSARATHGELALQDIHFSPDSHGSLRIWAKPEIDSESIVTDRYLTVVDIGGRSSKADWSVIAVFDRLGLAEGQPPAIVAQWRGHLDIDLLAWKAAQIAAYYDNSLLVIESNTLETHDRERQIEGGDQSQYVLNQISTIYPNLYARRQSEDEILQGLPRKYGFHTNTYTKPLVISALIRAVRDRLYIERDTEALAELLTYERKPNGAYGAISGHHDDILMTRAIGIHISLSEMEIPQIIPNQKSRHQKSKRGLVSEAAF